MKSKRNAIEPGQLVRPFRDPRPGRGNPIWLYESPLPPTDEPWPCASGIPPWDGDQVGLVLCHREDRGRLYLELLVAGVRAWAYEGWVEPIG